MGNISSLVGGSVTLDEPIKKAPEAQLIEAMLDAGLTPPAAVYLDGKIHRFCTSGKKGDSGWYVVFPDGVPAGQFGDWRTGITVSFRADIGRPLTALEEMAHTRRMAEAKAIRETEEKAKHEVAANTVELIWAGATHAGQDHPYLKRKNIEPHQARVTGDGRLIVPLYNAEGKLCSIQYISADGDKKYHPGGETGECFWSLGTYDESKPIYIAEGFATAATIHQHTDTNTYIAYSASNLVPVTRIIRELYGKEQEIVIVADNDASGTGQKYADQASAKYGAKIIMPPAHGDANDYVEAGGDLKALLNPPRDEWIVDANTFASQPSPVKWLVKNWIQEESLIMVHGPSGAGKSFAVLDWLLHMAAHKVYWSEFKVKVKGGTAVYLAGEGHAGLRGRIAAWKQHNKVDKVDMYVSKSGCDLNTPEGYRKVVEELRALKIKPSSITVDTMHRFMAGDENSSQDAKTMLDACAALMREFSCTVILVHHTGVSEDAQHRARGSSAYRAGVDIEISIVPIKQAGNGRTRLRIVQRKSKDSEMAAPVTCELVVVPIEGWFDEDGNTVTSAVIHVTEVGGVEDEGGGDRGLPKGLAEKVQVISDAWLHCGREVDDNGFPTISKSALADYLINTDYCTEKSVRTTLAVTEKGRLIGALVEGGILSVKREGNRNTVTDFIITEEILVSSLLMQRKSV